MQLNLLVGNNKLTIYNCPGNRGQTASLNMRPGDDDKDDDDDDMTK